QRLYRQGGDQASRTIRALYGKPRRPRPVNLEPGNRPDGRFSKSALYGPVEAKVGGHDIHPSIYASGSRSRQNTSVGAGTCKVEHSTSRSKIRLGVWVSPHSAS